MNHDLESALGELADRAEQSHRVGRAPLPVARITARARTRRRTRAAVAIGGAAAAVVIVAGTAFAFLPDRTSPAPPAITPSPSVTTTTPAPHADADPDPDRRAGGAARRQPRPAVRHLRLAGVVGARRPGGHPRRRAGGAGRGASMASGGHLAVGGEVERSPELGASLVLAVPDGGPRVAIVRDGRRRRHRGLLPRDVRRDVRPQRQPGRDGLVPGRPRPHGLRSRGRRPGDPGTSAAGGHLRAAAVGRRS